MTRMDLYLRQGRACADCGAVRSIRSLILHRDGGVWLLCPPCKIDADVDLAWDRDLGW